MPASHHSVFTEQMPFLPPNQQCQSTENKNRTTKEAKINDPSMQNLTYLGSITSCHVL